MKKQTFKLTALLAAAMLFCGALFAQTQTPAPAGPVQMAVPAQPVQQPVQPQQAALDPTQGSAPVMTDAAPATPLPAKKPVKKKKKPVKKHKGVKKTPLKAPAAPAVSTATASAAPANGVPEKQKRTPIGSILSKLDFDEVGGPGFQVFTRVVGTATAEGLIEVLAPFDGRITDIGVQPGQWVKKDDVLGFMASQEMAAMLHASSEANRDRLRKRWQEMYPQQVLRAPATGLVVGLNARDTDYLYQGDRILTLASKMYLNAITAEKIYTPLTPGMTGEILSVKGDVKASVILRKAMELGATGRFKVLLEIVSTDKRIRPGVVFDGKLLIAEKPDASVVPVDALIRKDGKTYILTFIEVRTGIRNEKYTEVDDVYPGEVFVYPDSLIRAARGEK